MPGAPCSGSAIGYDGPLRVVGGHGRGMVVVFSILWFEGGLGRDRLKYHG